MKRVALLALLSFAAAGCAAALREPPPVARLAPDILAPGSAIGERASVDRLLIEAEAHFSRRDVEGETSMAERLFLEAARADETRVDGLLGLARSTAWLIEHGSSVGESASLVTAGVQAAQLCKERAPALAACDYALAIALGQQARERRATGHDGLAKMLTALRRAIAADPGLDNAGPHRVLALLFLRAPGWPAGPGDAEAGLLEARAAVALAPDHPANLLALAEALRRNGQLDDARVACLRAIDLAHARRAAGDPDASDWLADATTVLGPA